MSISWNLARVEVIVNSNGPLWNEAGWYFLKQETTVVSAMSTRLSLNGWLMNAVVAHAGLSSTD